MADLRLTIDGTPYTATWTAENPDTQTAISSSMPFEGIADRWGGELYFSVPVDVPMESGRRAVTAGSVAYWPYENALCLFWGPTPASDGDEPRAASPVAEVATLEEMDGLADFDSGARVRVTQA